MSALCLTGTALAKNPHDAGSKPHDAGSTAHSTGSRETCFNPQIEQPFLAFGDARNYVLAPGGSFEDPSLPGWTLTGGAAVKSGNEPFHLHGAQDRSSLSLPPRASATSPMMCVDLNWPTMRFMALQRRARDARLVVEVLYPDRPGKSASWHPARKLKAKRADGWHPTDHIKVFPQLGGSKAGARPVALRFTSGARSSWRIDDIYVDPRMK